MPYVSGQWDVLDAVLVSSFIQPADGRVIKARMHSADKHGLNTYRSAVEFQDQCIAPAEHVQHLQSRLPQLEYFNRV